MVQLDATICAVSTASGVGGIAVLRISGKQAVACADAVFRGKHRLSERSSASVSFGQIVDAMGNVVDEVLCTVFRAPHSFTGEDVVEIACHGSLYLQQRIMSLLLDAGCVLAAPGEFTERAFMHGKLDLSQAEAVADVIAASSAAAHRVAMNQMRGGFSQELAQLRDKLLAFTALTELELDFSEEDVEFADRERLQVLLQEIEDKVGCLVDSFATGHALKHGIPVAIVGETNAGKSTLLNVLLHEEKAIVADFHGTTRDTIEDVAVLDGVLFRFIDTAGIRQTEDVVENLGIKRSYKAIEQASVVVWMIDATAVNEHIDWMAERIVPRSKGKGLLLVFNKIDKISAEEQEVLENLFADIQAPRLYISALQGLHIDALQQALLQAAQVSRLADDAVVVTNLRHYEALRNAQDALSRIRQSLASGLSGDLLSIDLHDCLDALGSITGQITSEEVLSTIFSRFCIGK